MNSKLEEIYASFLNAIAYRFSLIPFNASSLYPIIKERWKNGTKISDATEATFLAGFNVKFPSTVPNDYCLQLGIVETAPDDNKHVLLSYSKNPITDSMRLNEFFIQKGIWIYYRKWESDPQKAGGFEFHIPDCIRAIKREGRDVYEITINGHRGIASSQRDRLFHGVDIHDPSQVEFMIEKTHITIQGYLAKEKLIKVAESIK